MNQTTSPVSSFSILGTDWFLCGRPFWDLHRLKYHISPHHILTHQESWVKLSGSFCAEMVSPAGNCWLQHSSFLDQLQTFSCREKDFRTNKSLFHLTGQVCPRLATGDWVKAFALTVNVRSQFRLEKRPESIFMKFSLWLSDQYLKTSHTPHFHDYIYNLSAEPSPLCSWTSCSLWFNVRTAWKLREMFHKHIVWSTWPGCKSWPWRIGVAKGKIYSNLNITFPEWVMAALDEWQENKRREKRQKTATELNCLTVRLSSFLLIYFPPLISVFLLLCVSRIMISEEVDVLRWDLRLKRRQNKPNQLTSAAHLAINDVFESCEYSN